MNRPFLPKAEEITHGLIVSGGPVDLTFAAGFLKNRSYELVIAVDAGLDTCLKLGLTPDLAVGDFDTFGRERMEALKENGHFLSEVHEPRKDETDTELAVHSALKAGCTHADVLGATGGRLDHELSNIQLLYQGKRRGLSLELYDAKNRIYLLDGSDGCLKVYHREELYGPYISFLPLTEHVKGITLRGFLYPLEQKNISILENPGLCVSNELAESTGVMRFEKGILICVESRD